jgi:hypothetical protein
MQDGEKKMMGFIRLVVVDLLGLIVYIVIVCCCCCCCCLLLSTAVQQATGDIRSPFWLSGKWRLFATVSPWAALGVVLWACGASGLFKLDHG